MKRAQRRVKYIRVDKGMGSRFLNEERGQGLVLCLVLAFLSVCTAHQYFPEKCSDRCSKASDYQQPLPNRPEGMNSRVAQWSIVALNQIKTNLESASPPGVGRALGLFSTCMYEATTLFDEDLEPFAAKNFFKIGRFDQKQLNKAIDGAAHRALTYLFRDFASVDEVDRFLENDGGSGGYRGFRSSGSSGRSGGFGRSGIFGKSGIFGESGIFGDSGFLRDVEDMEVMEHLDFDLTDFSFPDLTQESVRDFFDRINPFKGLDRLTESVAMRAGSFVCGRVIEKVRKC